MAEQTGIFSKGFKAAAEIHKTQASQFKPTFWLKDGEAAKVVMLDGEPISFNQHRVQVRGKWQQYTCRGKGCPLCVGNEARIASVFRIIGNRLLIVRVGGARQS